MSEVIETVTVTALYHLAVLDQGIQAGGQAGKFFGVVSVEVVAAALFDLLQVGGDGAQRPQAPAQDEPLCEQQHHGHAAEPAPQGGTETVNLCLEHRGIFRYREGVQRLCAAIVSPGNAEGEGIELPVCQREATKVAFTGWLLCGCLEVASGQGAGAPQRLLVVFADGGIQA